MRVVLAGTALLTVASLGHATESGTLEVWQPFVDYPDPVVVLYEEWVGIFGSARSFSTNADFYGLGVFGDTAKVILDLSGAELNNPMVDHTLHQTIDCILLNARRSWPTIRYVGLDVVGSDGFAPCSGTYGLDAESRSHLVGLRRRR